MIRSERGQALIEFALLLPILIWGLFGVIDLGIAFGRTVQLANACREGARYGSINPLWANSTLNADPNNVKYTVKRTATGMILSDTNITVQFETVAVPAVDYDATQSSNASYGVTGNGLRVTATYSYAPIAPFVGVLFPNGTITLSSTSVARIE